MTQLSGTMEVFFLQKRVCLPKVCHADAMKCSECDTRVEKINTFYKKNSREMKLDRDQISRRQNTSCLLSAGDPASSLTPAGSKKEKHVLKQRPSMQIICISHG